MAEYCTTLGRAPSVEVRKLEMLDLDEGSVSQKNDATKNDVNDGASTMTTYAWENRSAKSHPGA